MSRGALPLGVSFALAVLAAACNAIFHHEPGQFTPGDAAPAFDGADGAAADCSDVSGDPSNCGACGHTCGGLACHNGECDPVVLLANTSLVGGIVADGDPNGYVYATSADYGTSILRVPKSPGVAEPIVKEAPNDRPELIALHEGTLYWTSGPDGPAGTPAAGTLQWASLDGGGHEYSADRMYMPWAIALDSSDVYFTLRFSTSCVRRMPFDGGPIATISGCDAGAGPDGELAIRVDPAPDGNVYWCGDGALYSMPKTGGQAVALNETGCRGLAIDDQSLYYSTAGTDVFKIPKSLCGGALCPVSVLAHVQATGVASVEVDDDSAQVYFAIGAPAGQVYRVHKGGDGLMVMVSQLQNPYAIAFDGDWVYVTARDDSRGIVKIHK
jgi:hypothetical protein